VVEVKEEKAAEAKVEEIAAPAEVEAKVEEIAAPSEAKVEEIAAPAPAEVVAEAKPEETKPEVETTESTAELILPPSLLTISVENPSASEEPTIVRCLGIDRRGQLAKLTASLSSFGLDIVSAFIRSDLEGNSFDDMFYVATPDGAQLPVSEHPALVAHMEVALGNFLLEKPLVMAGGSNLPNIYGMASSFEATAIRARVEEAVDKRVVMAKADPVFMALQLELAAAELAAAAAEVVTIERASAKLVESCEFNADPTAEFKSECEVMESSRIDARVVLERRMTAMEAVLAQRDRFRAQQASANALAPPPGIQIPKPQQFELPKLYPATLYPPQSGGTHQAPAVEAAPPQAASAEGVDAAVEPKEVVPEIPFSNLPSTPCGNGREIILQGFNWESCKSTKKWFNVLNDEVAAIGKAGFTAVWLPPPTASVSTQGYLPTDLYNLNSLYGSEEELRACIKTMKAVGLTPVADIVINHRCAEAQDDQGRWNKYLGKMAWDARAITNDNPEFGGQGSNGSGDDYAPAPNIDHTQEWVRNDLKTWLNWMRDDVGFRGWRFDFVKGYSGKYTGEYVDATRPFLSFGEFWDACNYRDGVLDYDQNSHRQRTCNWVDSAGGNTAAFDFTTKGILQEAVARGEYWRLVDPQGNPPGFVGMWPSRAVTFLENHDTGSTLQHWPFPEARLGEGYAYILTHPGTPTVFYDHWKDPVLKGAIDQLIQIRLRCGITSNSAIHIERATAGVYAAHVGTPKDANKVGSSSDIDSNKPSLCMKIGFDEWSPNRTRVGNSEWKCKASGEGWAVWESMNFTNIDSNSVHATVSA